MLRWLTAGESHGAGLVAILEGLPAGVRITTGDIGAALERRRAGYGRGARMKFEQDEVEIVAGVRHGRTLGSPVAVRVANTEWPKWQQVMSADPVGPDVLVGQRSDTTAVPAAGVVAESMVALVLAEAALEKFGGDSIEETARNGAGYLSSLRIR